MVEYDSVRAMQGMLASYGLTLKKRYGQNFLVNPGIRERILDAAVVGPSDVVWEIGPGIGALTHKLIRSAAEVVAFEIDHGFGRVLQDLYGGDDSFRLVPGDFVETFPAELAERGAPDRVVGNLPYSTASAMIVEMAVRSCVAGRSVFTVQRETAERMYAPAGSAEYSLLSVVCRSVWLVERVGRVKPGSFYPPPRVESEVVLLRPRPGGVGDPAFLLTVCRTLFGSRRKTIRNNVKNGVSGLSYRQVLDSIERIGVSADARAESVEVEKLVELAEYLNEELHCAGGDAER